MSHSSGLPNQIVAASTADPSLRDVELEQGEAVRRYASGDLAFTPGFMDGGFRVLARRVLADGHTVIVMNNTSFDQTRFDALGDALLAATYP